MIVLSLTESVNSLLEENETVVSIFLDLAKAFNSISHKIFLEKIAKYGFSTESIAMLESFLSNRKQCVKNGIAYSNWVTINHGVPQGTVFGPLIFIMNINNFPEKMKKREDVFQFADDTCIFCHSKSDENLLCEINSVFENTDSYMRQNMLTLNRDKTGIVFFSKIGESKIEQLHYNGIFIEPKTSCRYLGIIIDNNLIFDIQLNKTLTKMANAIRSIYLVRHFLPLKARIGLFKSLVLSHLNFSAIFFQSLSVMSLQRVNSQINWGINDCHLRKKFDSARDLLLKCRILSAELFI